MWGNWWEHSLGPKKPFVLLFYFLRKSTDLYQTCTSNKQPSMLLVLCTANIIQLQLISVYLGGMRAPVVSSQSADCLIGPILLWEWTGLWRLCKNCSLSPTACILNPLKHNDYFLCLLYSSDFVILAEWFVDTRQDVFVFVSSYVWIKLQKNT